MCVLDFFFFFKQKTAYEMRISDWSSDVCSSDLPAIGLHDRRQPLPRGKIVLRHPDPDRVRRHRLHPVIEFGVAHLTQQLLRVSGANEPLVDQRDAVGMECDASDRGDRSEEHTSELQSLMRISYAGFFLKKKTNS